MTALFRWTDSTHGPLVMRILCESCDDWLFVPNASGAAIKQAMAVYKTTLFMSFILLKKFSFRERSKPGRSLSWPVQPNLEQSATEIRIYPRKSEQSYLTTDSPLLVLIKKLHIDKHWIQVKVSAR
jgi:hypothetical protein